jgi:RNA polymerase-binding protein DksA
MRKTDLARFKKILTAEKERVTKALARHTKIIENAAEESGGGSKAHSNHMADQGSDENNYETMLQMTASEKEYLREIDAALDRIEEGTYGICEVTGKRIGLERLKAIPTARLSIEAQEELEARALGMRR